MPLRAVLFDFSETLFHLPHAERILDMVGPEVAVTEIEALLEQVRAASSTPEELAKGRDLSPEAHRHCWTELFRPFDRLAPGLAGRIYADISDPGSWHPYPETIEVLETLERRGVPIGVVSDIGWDIRTVFDRFGVRSLVATWVLSFEQGREKPDPALFLAGCAGLGTSPAETLMVGDNVERDGGAAATGLTALTLPRHRGTGERGLRPVLDLVDKIDGG
ncbi:MAG: HAD family hydrolase [Actinomycetota bacterium]